jgi:hypothetical protein
MLQILKIDVEEMPFVSHMCYPLSIFFLPQATRSCTILSFGRASSLISVVFSTWTLFLQPICEFPLALGHTGFSGFKVVERIIIHLNLMSRGH